MGLNVIAGDHRERGNLIIKGGFDESNPCKQLYIMQKVGLINQAPTIMALIYIV